MTRREFVALAGTVPLIGAPRRNARIAIGKAASYSEDLSSVLARMFDQLGGLESLVRGKTVTVKLNLTGSPALRFQGRPLGSTHYVHPKLVGAVAHQLGQAGARRIRLVESCAASAGPLQDYLLDCGWNVRALAAAAIEFENTNALGQGKRYSRLKVPGRPYMYPAFDLNHAYEDTDVFVSLAKLKNHETCGVTLSLNNIFGITPCSIYGDDAGRDGPNESPTKGRAASLHFAKRRISSSAPQEVNASPSHDPGFRVPGIVADLAAARPIDLAIIDGVETIAGGEGPWVEGIRTVRPGLLIAGMNPVAADAVAVAAMGYDPRAAHGAVPFTHCRNTLLLAEAAGLGPAALDHIDLAGVPLSQAVYRFAS